MKKFYLILNLLIVGFAFGQAPLNVVKPAPIPYESVELQPIFPGGNAELMKYIGKNFKTPELENGGDIVVTFVIETNGFVGDVKILKDLGNGSGEEAKRVMLACPKWKPGEVNGVPVRVVYKLPIKIKI